MTPDTNAVLPPVPPEDVPLVQRSARKLLQDAATRAVVAIIAAAGLVIVTFLGNIAAINWVSRGCG